MPQTDPVMLRMLRMRLIAIAFASFSGGSVYACCVLAFDSACVVVAGAACGGAVEFCAFRVCGIIAVERTVKQTATHQRLILILFS
jgi:hypothetical protein